MKLCNIRYALRHDDAENSIMQTITIAVSAILIAAGLMTAPALIINAKDNNAKTDLANLAFAEEWALSNTSKYYANVNEGEADSLFEQTTGADLSTGIKYTLSGDVTNHSALVCKDSGWHYLIKATSDSGKTFYIASDSGYISTDIDNLSIATCITGLPEYAAFVA